MTLLRNILIALVLVCGNSQGREWKSNDGQRTFDGQLVSYRPPNVTVYRQDGQKITFDESLLSDFDRQYCALANHVLTASYPKIPYKVIQVLNYGLICSELRDQNPYYSGEILFIWGDYRATVADNDVYRGDIYWAGSYNYTTVSGEDRTIRSFAMSLDDAVAIWRYRLSPPKDTEGGNRPAQLTKESLSATGTGFAGTNDGYVVTNAHVVEGATKITVRVGEQRLDAKIVALDQQNDLAVVKVDGLTVPLPLANAEGAKLGDEVTVGGFPNPDIQGTSLKLTRGVISGMKGIKDDIRHFQIDAAVQPGNSGGPLVSATGTVVGIVNARLNDSAVALATGALPQNVNYAIKIDYLLPLLRSAEGLKIPEQKSSTDTATSIGTSLEKSTYYIQCDIKP